MESALNAAKSRLRAQMREKRRALDPGASSLVSARVQGSLLADPRWKKARTIGLYAALPGEVATDRLFQDAIARGQGIAYPWVPPPRPGEPVERVLRFFRVRSTPELSAGTYGILEPPAEPDRGVALDALDLIVVPCLACDRAGGRLGRGGGHYDATLPHSRRDAARIGLCFGWQLVDAVPAGPLDARLDAVATEDGIFPA